MIAAGKWPPDALDWTPPGRGNAVRPAVDDSVAERCWADRVMITDPAHVGIAKTLRAAFSAERLARDRASRQHTDGHRVTLRALSDSDVLFDTGFGPVAATGVTTR